MHLDIHTVSTVNIAVTTILGLVLIFTWARERTSPLVGWWGVAQLIQATGIVVTVTGSLRSNTDIVAFGTALMIFADATKWNAARQFENRNSIPYLIFLGPIAFLAAVFSGLVASFGARLILLCTLMALYNIAAAVEFARGWREPLKSRTPAVVLLVLTAATYLSWLSFNGSMPVYEVALVFASSWFPAVLLVTLLIRVALSFMVLAVAKERQELKQRLGALTDSLTGLPNRRALFEAADVLTRRDTRKIATISVVLFDLDRFKETNDSFGHPVGDRVLGIFASTLKERVNADAIIARVGGEEFAAILPNADAMTAVEMAEAVRSGFASSGAFVDGVAVGATVSVGVACNLGGDCNLSSLFRQADAALYAAKRAGRNRVELIGPEQGALSEALHATVRAGRPHRTEGDAPIEHSAA